MSTSRVIRAYQHIRHQSLSEHIRAFLCYLVCCECYATGSSILIASNAIPNDGVMLSCAGTNPQVRLNGTTLDFSKLPPAGLLFSSVTSGRIVTIIQSHVLEFNGSLFQCSPDGFNFSNSPTTSIIVYGMSIIQTKLELSCCHKACYIHFTAGLPSEPVGLSLELSQVAGVLVLSWSPPWAPDGVQLNYTVTVRLTNTNSTSTTTITMFNTSSTTITISRDNITTSAGSSECDQYVWSVTAINPAGSSLPTNSTTPVTIRSGLPTIVSLSLRHVIIYSSSRWYIQCIV